MDGDDDLSHGTIRSDLPWYKMYKQQITQKTNKKNKTWGHWSSCQGSFPLAPLR